MLELLNSPALSQERTKKTDSIKSRRVAILVAERYNNQDLTEVMQALKEKGAHAKVISMFKGMVKSADGQEVEVDKNHVTTGSIMYDAVFIPGGKESVEAMKKQGDALHFINKAFKHCKPIAAINEGVDMVLATSIKGVRTAEMDSQGELVEDEGVVTIRNASEYQSFINAFRNAIARHRHWMREEKMQVPAFFTS